MWAKSRIKSKVVNDCQSRWDKERKEDKTVVRHHDAWIPSVVPNLLKLGPRPSRSLTLTSVSMSSPSASAASSSQSPSTSVVLPPKCVMVPSTEPATTSHSAYDRSIPNTVITSTSIYAPGAAPKERVVVTGTYPKLAKNERIFSNPKLNPIRSIYAQTMSEKMIKEKKRLQKMRWARAKARAWDRTRSSSPWPSPPSTRSRLPSYPQSSSPSPSKHHQRRHPSFQEYKEKERKKKERSKEKKKERRRRRKKKEKREREKMAKKEMKEMKEMKEKRMKEEEGIGLQANTQVVAARGMTNTTPTALLCGLTSARHSATEPPETSGSHSDLDGSSASDRRAVSMSAHSNQNGSSSSSRASHGGAQSHRNRYLTIKSIFSTASMTNVPKPQGPGQQPLSTSPLLTANHDAYGTSTGTPPVILASDITDICIKGGLNAVTSPKEMIDEAKRAETKTSSRGIFHQFMNLGRWKRNKERSINDDMSNHSANTGAVLRNVAMNRNDDFSLQGNRAKGVASTSFNPASSGVRGGHSLPLFEIFTPTDASVLSSVSATMRSPGIKPRQNKMGAIHDDWALPSVIDPSPSFSHVTGPNKGEHGSEYPHVPAVPESDEARPKSGHDLAVNSVFEVPMPACVKDQEVQWNWSNTVSHVPLQPPSQVWMGHKRLDRPADFIGNFEMYPMGAVPVIIASRRVFGEPTVEHLPGEADGILTLVDTWSNSAEDARRNFWEDQHILIAHSVSGYSGTERSTLNVYDWQDSSSFYTSTLYDENEFDLGPLLNHPYWHYQILLSQPHLRHLFPSIIVSYPIAKPSNSLVFENGYQTHAYWHESSIPHHSDIDKQDSGNGSIFSISGSPTPIVWAPGSSYVPVNNNTVEVTCDNCRRKFLMTAKDPEVVNRHQRWMCRTRFQQRIQCWWRTIEARFKPSIEGRPGQS